MRTHRLPLLAAFLLFTAQVCITQAQSPEARQVPINAPYLGTPAPIVDAMLDLAKVKSNDVVYDLGCGDGRIVISAAKKYGARGVGIDINPVRIEEARVNARAAGVEGRIVFEAKDLFDSDFHDATVVALYLLPEINMRLRPRLLSELKPGARVVSHSFTMGDWKPDKEIVVDGEHLYLWIIPGAIPGK
jgi:cyclopropane fatty-acyl-phospholipid synthase-like methyltransferase